VTRKQRPPGKRHDAGPPAGGGKAASICAACGTPARPGAKFCHECGARLGGRSPGGWSRAVPVALLAGLVVVVFAVVVGVAFMLRPELFRAPQSASRMPQSASGAPAASSAPSADLSQMSPKEAADWLFNRTMRAQELGNPDEARRFAPMALEAYGRIDGLDADAHYHLGLLYGVMDDDANMRRQIDALRQVAPNHLLAFALEHELALKRGDEAAAERAVAALNAAYDSEIAAGRPEYEAHSFSIDRLRAGSSGRMAAAAQSFLAEGTAPGAALYVAKCAECHGIGATGTDKGPPLVHRIYEPGHHGDDAIRRAVREGAPAHHWKFGDMPPVDGLSDREVDDIIVYVRALQVAAGIR